MLWVAIHLSGQIQRPVDRVRNHVPRHEPLELEDQGWSERDCGFRWVSSGPRAEVVASSE